MLENYSFPVFKFALKYATTRVHENQEGVKFNGTRERLACADYVNIFKEHRFHTEKYRNSIRC
jgi:hypothetical protein